MTAPGFITSAWTAPVISLVALAGTLCALGLIAAAERRLRERDLASRSALETGGKLIQNAAKRLMAAQDAQLQEAELAAGQTGQAGSRLIGAVREVEARLRACLDEAEARLRDQGVHASRQDAAALAEATGSVQARIAEAGAAVIEAIQCQVAEASRAIGAILDTAIQESRTSPEATSRGGEAAMAKAAAAAPAGARCVAGEGWVESVRLDFASLHALAASMTAGLVAIEEAGRHAAAWPAISSALEAAVESVRSTQHAEGGGPASATTELCPSIGSIEAAVLVRDHAAGRVFAAAARVEQAADRVAAMIPQSGRGVSHVAHGLLAQVDALHADARRLAAAVGQDGVPDAMAGQVAVLAGDVLHAMERLQATSSLLGSMPGVSAHQVSGEEVRTA